MVPFFFGGFTHLFQCFHPTPLGLRGVFGKWTAKTWRRLQVKFSSKSLNFSWQSSLMAAWNFAHSAAQAGTTNYSFPLKTIIKFFKTSFISLLSSSEKGTNHHVKTTQLPSNAGPHFNSDLLLVLTNRKWLC